MNFRLEDIVCVCRRVKKRAIIDSILLFGAETVEDIGKLTNAGITCGGCQEDIEEILKECGVI